MKRKALSLILVCSLSSMGCARRIVPDRGIDFAQEAMAACATDGVVAHMSGEARARDVRVRDVTDGDGKWLEICALNPASPAVWTSKREAIALKDAVLQFREERSGATAALVAGIAGATIVLLFVIGFAALKAGGGIGAPTE